MPGAASLAAVGVATALPRQPEPGAGVPFTAVPIFGPNAAHSFDCCAPRPTHTPNPQPQSDDTT
eukprot:290780-Prymnesium_polylepis.1